MVTIIVACLFTGTKQQLVKGLIICIIIDILVCIACV